MDNPNSKLGTEIDPNSVIMTEARRSADKARQIAENDALNRIQPGQSEKAKAVWQGEGGSTASDTPLPTIYPKL